jgi:hypothetical protein
VITQQYDYPNYYNESQKTISDSKDMIMKIDNKVRENAKYSNDGFY